MLSKMSNILSAGWIASLIFGVSCGLAFYAVQEALPSKYSDILFHLFGFQYLLAVLLAKSSSFYYVALTALHFVLLARIAYWLALKQLSVQQWSMVVGGYLLVSIIVFYVSAYIFFHFVMSIGMDVSR